MSVAKSLVRGSMLRVSHTVLSMAVSFIMMPIFINELGDKWYGIWTIVSGFMGVYFIFDLGVTSAVSRYVSRYKGLEDARAINVTINTALAIFCCIAFIVVVMSISLSFFSARLASEPEDIELIRTLILITGFSVALEFPFNAFAGIPEANSRFDLLTGIRLFTLLGGAIANYWLITEGYGVLAIAVVAFVTARLSNLGYFFLARHLFPAMKINPKLINRQTFRELFHFSKWSFAVEVSANLPYRFNTLLIGYFLSAAWVTHYVIGQRLVEYANKFLMQATNLMTPIFTQYHARGEYAEMHGKVLLMVRLNTFLGMLTIGGLYTFAELFITRWVGTEYPESYQIVYIRIIGVIGVFIFSSLNNVLYAINRHSIIAKITIFDGVFTLIGGVILVQSLGIVGIALAATIPALIGRGIFLPYFSAKEIRLPVIALYRACLPLILLGAVIIAAEYWVIQLIQPDATYFAIFGYATLFSLFYMVVMFFIGLGREERALIFRALPFVSESKASA